MSTLINPTTGAELDHSPVSASLEDTDTVIARAHSAFPAWREVSPGERARLLRAFAAVVDAHLEDAVRSAPAVREQRAQIEAADLDVGAGGVASVGVTRSSG